MRIRVAIAVVTVAAGLHAAILVGLGQLSKGRGPLIPAPLVTTAPATPSSQPPVARAAPAVAPPSPAVAPPSPAPTQPRRPFKRPRRSPPAPPAKLPVLDLKFPDSATEDGSQR